jgi:alkylation response protein AidB-like acyl-CoA dehydrogenase
MNGKEPLRDEHGNPKQLLVVFPASDAQIVDTWHTIGMRGTGSNDISMNDVFVPERLAGRVAPLTVLPPACNLPIFRMTVWFPVAGLGAPALGCARAAIDDLLELAAEKTPSYTRTKLAERPVVQRQIAEAEALVGSARAYLHETVRDAWDSVSQGEFLTQPHKIAIQLATSHAIRAAAQAVDLVQEAAGTSAIRQERPFERYFRDIHTMTQHAFGSVSRFESAGKLLFRQETDWPFFAM